MKIKHWQGYGTVTAKKISLEKQENGHRIIRILVSGNHECGIECNDKYTLTNWLLKRFDKDVKGIPYDYRNIISTSYKSDVINKTDTCEYTIEYRI